MLFILFDHFVIRSKNLSISNLIYIMICSWHSIHCYQSAVNILVLNRCVCFQPWKSLHTYLFSYLYVVMPEKNQAAILKKNNGWYNLFKEPCPTLFSFIFILSEVLEKNEWEMAHRNVQIWVTDCNFSSSDG